jgi:hypothetical protein
MPDLSDTVAKCRMGTAKKFYTSIASLSHMSKEPGHQTADGWCRNHAAGNYPDSTAGNIVLLRGVVDEHHH